MVVYSIIFYGIKTWLNVRNNKVRTDKETRMCRYRKAA